jgi:hypothetical protein
MTEKLVWIPESPSIPGLYAAEVPRALGKDGVVDMTTRNAHWAYQFSSQDECQKWCDGWNSAQKLCGLSGMFKPVAHGFA